ncbi:MAG: DJ-1/PfpI family protein [Inquilinaceae bacterium]
MSHINDRAGPFRIGLLCFPRMTQLDLTGPFEVFARMAGAEVLLLWKTLDPVATDRGLSLLPTETLDGCPQLDLVCVPGGPGQIDLMTDETVLAFLRRQAPGCRYVTSVCTGSLVLGAAGLLRGYRATSHWLSLDQLALLGADPVSDRVVIDRNRITGAGVTSGIDFALTVVASILGEQAARDIQLAIEYDPAPPFAAGSPKTAPADAMARARDGAAAFQQKRRAVTETAARALSF